MIHHVALETHPDDVEDAIAFWALLGFERVEPPDTLLDIAVWLQRAGTHVHLLFAQDPIVVPRGHVGIVADDYTAAVERLEGAGFACDPHREHWGSPRCFVTAPGGHQVEVMAVAPDA